MNVCWIYGALGGLPTCKPKPGDFVIAADAGLRNVQVLGIAPDLIVGDFDSLGDVPVGENVIRHPVRKDDTDLMLALKEGLKRGLRSFIVCGCVGGRLDQTLASVQSAAYVAEHGGCAVLTADGCSLTVLNGNGCSFPAGAAGTLSVFALTECRGVTLSGLSYPLLDAALTPAFPLGVSNRFTGASAEIRVKEGLLAVYFDGEPNLITVEGYA